MIYTTERRKVTVHGDAKSYEQRYNEILSELAERGIIEIEVNEVIDPSADLPFACTIEYEDSYNIPECIADRQRLKGNNTTCKSCPHFAQEDKRAKRGLCTFKDREVNRTDYACDNYFLLRDLDIE